MDPNETTTNLTETWVCWLIVCAFVGWMAQQPVLTAEEIEEHIITEATTMSSPADIRPGETRLQAKRRRLAEKRKIFEHGMAAAKNNSNADDVVSRPNWKKKLLAKSYSPPPSMAKTIDDSVSSSPTENVTVRSPLTSTTKKTLNDNNSHHDDIMATYPAAPIPPPPPSEPLSPIYFAFETNHKLSLQQRRQQLAERRRKFESRMMTVNQDNNRSNSSGMGITSPPSVQRKSATKPEAAAASSPVPLPSPSQEEDASKGIVVPTSKDIQPTNLFPASSTATTTSAAPPTMSATSETTQTTSVADQRKIFEQGNVSNSSFGGSGTSIGHANNSRNRLDVVASAVTTSPTPTKQRVSKLQQPRATPPGKTISRQQQDTPVSTKKQETTSTTPAKATPSKGHADSQEKATPSKVGWMNRFGWTSPGKKKGSPNKSSARSSKSISY